jgi:hypothetical protein
VVDDDDVPDGLPTIARRLEVAAEDLDARAILVLAAQLIAAGCAGC